ncbi:MAG: cytochrome c biogenesis protein CcdA, partial [Dehalococcoidia bacterium]
MIETFVDNLAGLLPFGWSFAVGMVTAVSPCGIAMLPAYIALYLGASEEGFWAKSALGRGGRALAMSGVVTLGFVGFFGVMGAALSLGGQFLMPFIPWAAVLIGVVLVLMGVFLLLGGHLYTSLPARLAARLRTPQGAGLKGFLVFGIAYAVAALSCTLPIFLAVVGSALATGGFVSGMLQFVSFALGMGLVITIITLVSALFKESASRWMHRLVPVVA